MMTTEQSATSESGIPPIKETIGTPAWRARRGATRYLGRSLGSALTMSAMTAASMLIASQLRSGTPWAGLNAMAGAVGLGPKRPRKRFDQNATVAGAGLLFAGFLALGAIYEGSLMATKRRRSLMTGLLAGLGSLAVDQLLTQRRLVPNLRRSMGDGGTIAKYAALALAAAR
jgi:hypothetical protein